MSALQRKAPYLLGESLGVSVDELVCVSVHPVLRGQRGLVEMTAVAAAAFARLDDHDHLVEALSVRTDEADGQGLGAARGAAASVHTRSAEGGSVETHAHTLPVGQAARLDAPIGRRALLPFLEIEMSRGAGSSHCPDQKHFTSNLYYYPI